MERVKKSQLRGMMRQRSDGTVDNDWHDKLASFSTCAVRSGMRFLVLITFFYQNQSISAGVVAARDAGVADGAGVFADSGVAAAMVVPVVAEKIYGGLGRGLAAVTKAGGVGAFVLWVLGDADAQRDFRLLRLVNLSVG